MSTPTDLAGFFRDLWATRFEDTCVVKTPGTPTLSTSGTYSASYSTTYSGPCLVRPAAASDVQAGEGQQEIRMYNVFLPYTSTSVLVDDLVDVTSTHDTYLNGKTFTVRNITGDTYNHRRQLTCEEVV